MCSWNFFICFHWAGPWTHIPFTFWSHFVCKFSHHRDNKSFILRPGSPSNNTVLVFHDFNETYSIITQLRLIDLHNFSENSQFLGASKLFLIEWTSLNARTIKHTLLSFAYPPIYACISYYSARILFFLNLKGALFHSLLELKITMYSIFIARSIWAEVSPLPVLIPGSIQVKRVCGELNPRPWCLIKSYWNQSVKCNERQWIGAKVPSTFYYSTLRE